MRKTAGQLDEAYIRARLRERMKQPFTYALHGYVTGAPKRYRIADDADDPIASTHEEVYAQEVVAALNHTCIGEHEWTPIAPETGEPPLAIWLWCIHCGCLKLGDEPQDPIFRPGRHQKLTIVEEK